MSTAVMWFRRDLRLHDNEALAAAVATSDDVAPLFVTSSTGAHDAGPTARAWLAASLASLDSELRERDSRLVLRRETAQEAVTAVAREAHARVVHCQRDWTPAGLALEVAVREALSAEGVELRVSEGQLLVAPGALRTASGGPYRVFTPFYRAWRRTVGPVPPLEAPKRVPPPTPRLSTADPCSPPVGAGDVARWWTPGAPAARERLAEFAQCCLHDYETQRDHPAIRGTSELSPRLSWGELSPRQIVHAALDLNGEDAEPFLRQLAWREFASHVLHTHPLALDHPIDSRFADFGWSDDPEGLEMWRTGRTGVPLVDAGMRQLASTGWMHNRVRLVCASFLTKDLLVPWQRGEEHFRQRLVDYDPPLNAFNWQWVAGCGTDAAPYFRIFNPMVQGTRFDPAGDYIRTWVPELAEMPSRWIHRPNDAPSQVLSASGVVLGKTYPTPVVDHAEARMRALAAYSAIKGER